MMRIQILPLPSVVVGETVEQPFALIVDQRPERLYERPIAEREADEDVWLRFARECGAKSIIGTTETVDVVDQRSGPDVQPDPVDKPDPEPLVLADWERELLDRQYAQDEIGRLAKFLRSCFPAVGWRESTVDMAIRLLSERADR